MVAFISSKLPAQPEEFDLIMRQGDTEFLLTGLRVDSVIKVNRMMTVTHTLMLRELGVLSGGYLRGVEELLRKLFRL